MPTEDELEQMVGEHLRRQEEERRGIHCIPPRKRKPQDEKEKEGDVK